MAMLKLRKLLGVKEAGQLHEEGYPLVLGGRYEEWLRQYHLRSEADWYLEVGSETGKSLVTVSANTIAVDPAFRLIQDVTTSKRIVHLFQMTSDSFFATDFANRNNIELDVAFLDGMHNFEFLLRDFIGTERISRSTATIFMHDCIPANRIQARREYASNKSRFWAGDVWKLLPILRQYRPHLRIEVLDLAPTGLVSVRNLDPSSSALKNNYEAILAEYTSLTLEEYGLSKFCQEFPLVPDLGRIA